jgi:ribonuclease HII
MKIAGVDEAGKGPVLGSMFVAGVMLDERRIHLLEELKVRDSKLVSPSRREKLAPEIEKIAGCFVVEITASQIDELREVISMNEILVSSYAKVLENLHPDKAFVDSPDVNAMRFAENIKKQCPYPVEIVSEHGADVKYPVVSAASIVAKVRRDASVAALEKKIGKPIGSGYPSDARTQGFLRALLKSGDALPGYVRRSWKTVEKAKNARLDEF